MKENQCMRSTLNRRGLPARLALFGGLMLLPLLPVASPAQNPNKFGHYTQVNLISDVPGVALLQDADLVNPWGITFSAAGPFWISDNGTGKATIYTVTNDASGTPTVIKAGLLLNAVNIPGAGKPTGQLFNGTPGFHGDFFIFASEDGIISGWRPALGTNAEVLAVRAGAVYKGVGLGTNASGPVLLAANFSEATVDVYNGDAVLVAQLKDADAPTGYAPFNVQNIEGTVIVTFAKQDEDKEDDVPGPGHGLIDVLDVASGIFYRVVTGSDAGGNFREINSPWGLALAPGTFGRHGGELLVGNFGSGTIMAFDYSAKFQGLLKGETGGAIEIEGLWALAFGNGGRGGDRDTLYFTAGPEDETHGLFGSLQPVKQGR